ncbi:hypothetical protein JDV02_008335 [Purpureocillium takamizusanense]|uniref:alpha-galactosidase n=1 Tax=Purpureocillium takamizusanense TaxID=2060973 RepID=A0A9Q8VEL7_9HYPO|nr:uncharacterized protein JDV02_008335 [Purpureocillium takamizusanense]UNI22446.1 hypothetical protein JDV02_008335 [Purpureocillium takamizusanense]
MLLLTLTNLGLVAGAVAAAATSLKVVTIGTTPDGTTAPIRGWNSWGTQAGKYLSDADYNEGHVRGICDRLAGDLRGNYRLCGLDSGWSVGDHGDDHGRISYDDSRFDIPRFARYLHGKKLLIGIYIVPGAFLNDFNKTIEGTNTKISDICGATNGLARCRLKYDHPDTEKWIDSNARQFASWGVDYIKLDFITPGSNDNGVDLPPDESPEVQLWHRAIAKTGRRMTLAISWKLDRSKPYFDIWRANADSMRVDQDIQSYSRTPFTDWSRVLRTLGNYLEWINAAVAHEYYSDHHRAGSGGGGIGTHPNLDTMYVLNNGTLSGLSLDQRRSVFIHWIGSSAELNLGDDLEQPDPDGLALLNDHDALAAAGFTANYPMQPRNPGSGGNAWLAQNAWIAGPAPSGEFIVVLANYDDGDAGTQTKTVSASFADLGVSGKYTCFDVFGKKSVTTQSGLSVSLKGGQSVMYRCTRAKH